MSNKTDGPAKLFRPLRVIFEGLDGCGKDSAIERVHECFETHPGIDVLRHAEPTNGPIGAGIRQLLNRHDVHLGPLVMTQMFEADRLMNHPAFLDQRGLELPLVLQSRSVLSTAAYQTAHRRILDGNAGGGVDRDAMRHIIEDHTQNMRARGPQLPLPRSIIIYLRVDPKTAMERIDRRGSDKEIYEHEELQREVFRNYELLFHQPATEDDNHLCSTAIQKFAGWWPHEKSTECVYTIQSDVDLNEVVNKAAKVIQEAISNSVKEDLLHAQKKSRESVLETLLYFAGLTPHG